MDFAPGIYEDISHVDYHSDAFGPTPTLSRSTAVRLIKDAPLHAWAFHPRLGGQLDKDDTEERDNGSLLHSLLLGGGNVAVIEARDFKTDKAKGERDAARAEGLTPVCRPKFEAGEEAAAAIRANLLAIGIDLTEYLCEPTILWEEEGVKCRCRPDLYHPKRHLLLDPKIVDRADADLFARGACRYGLEIQWAAYTSGLEHIFPKLAGRGKLKFLLCERKPPYDVDEVEPLGPTKNLGRTRWHKALHQWKECLEADRWPGRYRGKARTFDVPSWELQAEFMAEMREAEQPDFMGDEYA